MASRLVRLAGVVLLAGMLSSSCGGAATEEVESPDPVAESQSVARTVDVIDVDDPAPTVPVLEDDVDPMGVITAAVVLHTGGDVDAALADGSFTRADLDAARRGLADGSLDHLFD